jgi:hypothetical protein
MSLKVGKSPKPTQKTKNRYSAFSGNDVTPQEVALKEAALLNSIVAPQAPQVSNTFSRYSQVPNLEQQVAQVSNGFPTMGQGNPYLDVPNTGASGSYLENLGRVESNGKWDAYNKGSKAYGRFQFIPSTEKAYAKKLGLSIEQARTPEGQLAMVERLTADNHNGLIKAGFEPTQENLYLSHQQGLGGALKMLRGGQAKAINLTSNGVSSYDEWRNKFAPKFR